MAKKRYGARWYRGPVVVDNKWPSLDSNERLVIARCDSRPIARRIAHLLNADDAAKAKARKRKVK